MKRLALIAAVAALAGLSACDKPKARHPDTAPVFPYAANAPSQAATPPHERAGPAVWDAKTGAFLLNGRPFKAAKLWTFDDSSEGFTMAGGATALAPNGGLRIVNTSESPLLLSPKDLALPGARIPIVLVRLTRVAAGGPWDGSIYYSTAAHGWAEAYHGVASDRAPPAVNETVTYVYDMSKAGGGDWAASVINQLRIDTDVEPRGAFIIREVAIGGGATPAAAAQ